MPNRIARFLTIAGLFGAVAGLPVVATDFHHWRTDGSHIKGSSVGQQATNQAFNIYDNLLDPASSTFARYWVSEHQENGGSAAGLWGDNPPTAAIKDNRPQDPEVDWSTWPVATTLAAPRPVFTPNVPQAWSPVELDLDTGGSTPDHLLFSVGFEPVEVGGTGNREQVLNAYYPQTAAGLPGNAQSLDGEPPPKQRGAVYPLWVRADGKPGLRIRDLAPVGDTSTGVVTHAPILARVPAIYRDGSSYASETIPVIYLVVGTGENSEFAHVICLALKKPGSQNPNEWLPDPSSTSQLDSFQRYQSFTPPPGTYFDPSNPSGSGAVMWAYRVRARNNPANPTPVAGISFADVGDTTDSRPLLFVTTADGQVICLNAKAADVRPISDDGDNSIDPDNPEPRWSWQSPVFTPAVGMAAEPGFHYGMAPAVARVPLTGLFPTTGATADTVNKAIADHDVSEWLVAVADTAGVFRTFEAPGKPVVNGGTLNRFDPLPRWQDAAVDAADADGDANVTEPDFRRDALGNPERFLVPPVVYQGNTPLRTSNGSLVSGTQDVGFDDEVIFASERGGIYILDAIGNLTIGGGNDGRPTGATRTRYVWPRDDSAFTSAADTVNGGDTEPRVWPRKQDKNETPIDITASGGAFPYDGYYSRAPLAMGYGSNTNPNGGSPNLDLGDDVIFVPYLQEQPATVDVDLTPRTISRPPNSRWFYEHVGSMSPYGFIQLSRPVLQLKKATAHFSGGGTSEIPLDRMRVGTVKTNGVPSTDVQTISGPTTLAGQPNPNYQQGGTIPDDTVYFVATHWYDSGAPGDGIRELRPGDRVEFEYEAPQTAGSTTPQTVTETILYPSCYWRRRGADGRLGPISRGRATLSVANVRLQQRRVKRDPGTPTTLTADDNEAPAVVLERGGVDVFGSGGGWRQPAMMAAGSAMQNGTLAVPSMFRGRVMVYSHRLQVLRGLFAAEDPRLQQAVADTFGPPRPNSVTDGVAHYGPPKPTGTPAHLLNDFDPGYFFTPGPPQAGDPAYPTEAFVEDAPAITDVGGSITMVDGWMYITYRNGHTTAYANVNGGASGTTGNGASNPPLSYPPAAPTNGTLVRAPGVVPGSFGIHVLKDPNGNPLDSTNWRDTLSLDAGLLVEMGETMKILVDFGPESELAPPETIDPHTAPTAAGGDDLDEQILQHEVQAQIRSSNGAVQQMPGLNRGVRPFIKDGHVYAVVPVFTGIPSPTNPLTPGTPLLFERDPSNASNDFTGEVTYEIQVTQPGVQWRWAPSDPAQWGQADATKQHYWEAEKNGPLGGNQNVRYPTTGGPGKWKWGSEWAPLISYNNPIAMYYDPDGPGGPLNLNGVPNTPGTPNNTIGLVDQYTDHRAHGRKNGDVYAAQPVSGARSGAGEPVVPTVGMALQGSAGKQILFGEHGKTTPAESTAIPYLAKLFVFDRSHLGLAGRSLTLRVQRAPLTKLGVGARLGGYTAPAGSPAGSYQQNANYLDDGPHQMYSSIPESRLIVSKAGTSVDLGNAAVDIPGRRLVNNTPTFPAGPADVISNGEALSVQVDIPRYTADDLYATRWRPVVDTVVNGRRLIGAPMDAIFNPFPGVTVSGLQNLAYRDRAEFYSRPTNGQPPMPAPNEDPGPENGNPVGKYQPDYDDRLRRVVLFNDANGNGQLDLLPTYREAYRTFAVQVAVKPEAKLEATEQVLDLGAVWHGKQQPGMGAGAQEIQEWQRMNQMQASGNVAEQRLAQFYRQYWRRFNLVNTGNVNLANVKPELVYMDTSGQKLIGLPSDGNDPWRAFPLLNVAGAAGPAWTDPLQIFLRTSFDDQLLPDAGSPYGAQGRGVWVQKPQMGAGQGASVVFANNPATAAGNPANRDPSTTGVARETWLTLNIPTGTPLGQYVGQVRFFNDQAIAFAENLSSGVGYTYGQPTGAAENNGRLERSSTTREPIEPASEPPVTLKVKVTENTIHGRHETVLTNALTQDPDRRTAPSVAPVMGQSGTLDQLLLAYGSNGANLPQQQQLQMFGTRLNLDPARLFFPYDQVPADRPPWVAFQSNNPGWDIFPRLSATASVVRPSVNLQAIDANNDGIPDGSVGALAWSERETLSNGQDRYRLRYQPFGSTAQFELTPGWNGGPAADYSLPRTNLQLLMASNNNWLALYATGSTSRRMLAFSHAATLGQNANWVRESILPTSKAFSSVGEPKAFITKASGSLPELAWVAYSGASQLAGTSDIYLSRFRVASLLSVGNAGPVDQLGRSQDYGRVKFPRYDNETLRADSTRRRYTMAGADLQISNITSGDLNDTILLQMWRPDVPTTARGSRLNPVNLIASGATNQGVTEEGELVYQISDPLANDPNSPLNKVRILVDPASGTVRFTQDTRTIARLLINGTPLTEQSPDPVIMATYTPGTLRITAPGVSASSPVIVPVLSLPGSPVYDASWYRQQLDNTKWSSGVPVAGIADRLWVFWRRASGAVGGGPTAFYKVLRPGVRLTWRSINATATGNIEALFNGASTIPEEVNPDTGCIYFPMAREGQSVTIRSYNSDGSLRTQETHTVTWIDETGEIPVPMDTSVNEGGMDAFASFEQVPMDGGTVRKMERMWMFWSSTRNAGADLYFATIAPRIGPEPNVFGSIAYSSTSGPLSPKSIAGLPSSRVQQIAAQLEAYKRVNPPLVPPFTRPGPLGAYRPLAPRR